MSAPAFGTHVRTVLLVLCAVHATTLGGAVGATNAGRLSAGAAHSRDATRAQTVPVGGEQTPLNSCATEHTNVICNYQDVYTCDVVAVVQPATVGDVVAAVRGAAAAGHTVRAVGHAHSDNDVFCAPGSVTLLMGGLDRISLVDTTNMTGT